MWYHQNSFNAYYFDKIRINSPEEPTVLKKKLPVNYLIKNSKYFSIRKTSFKARMSQFKSSIEIVAPSQKFLQLLLQHEHHFKDYYISYLEIAKDTFCKTTADAINLCQEKLRTTRKKYSSDHFIYDQTNKDPSKKRNNYNQLFGERTGYYGGEIFMYVVYPRISKITGRPCFHEEWRIKGFQTIKTKTTISSISDLCGFDLKTFFEDQYYKHIVHEKIDQQKLGKWLLGCTKTKKVSRRKFISIGVHALHFCEANEIRTYADLVKYFKKEKPKIKSRKGRRSVLDNKILSVRNYSMFRED